MMMKEDDPFYMGSFIPCVAALYVTTSENGRSYLLYFFISTKKEKIMIKKRKKEENFIFIISIYCKLQASVDPDIL
jgi:hypothetical protein